MSFRDDRTNLIRAHARAETGRGEVGHARLKILRAARAQRDALNETIHTVEQHVDAREGGDILAYRRLRTLHDERRRLDEVLARHSHLLADDDGGHPADDEAGEDGA